MKENIFTNTKFEFVMRYLSVLLVVATMMFTCNSCSDDDEPIPGIIYVSIDWEYSQDDAPDLITLHQTEGLVTITVPNDGATYRFKCTDLFDLDEMPDLTLSTDNKDRHFAQFDFDKSNRTFTITISPYEETTGIRKCSVIPKYTKYNNWFVGPTIEFVQKCYIGSD